jgi:hypothetical protein
MSDVCPSLISQASTLELFDFFTELVMNVMPLDVTQICTSQSCTIINSSVCIRWERGSYQYFKREPGNLA